MNQQQNQGANRVAKAAEFESGRLCWANLGSSRIRTCSGYALANKGHDTRALQAYLGHRNIQHTVRYTELSTTRFKDFWRE
jgi:site-specific recombinase XerD